MKKLGIYIHIPFCESKCYYCDFNSAKATETEKEDYVNLLLKEIDLYKSYNTRKVETIFIGGGTPSSIDSKLILEILRKVRAKFDTSEVKEITIECNPGTLDVEKVSDYKKAGINRVSLGLQTKEDAQLVKLGRIHKYSDFLNSVEILKEGGIDNISVDLMIGLPNQTLKQILDTIDEINKLELNHVSMYGLKLEEGTRFDDMYEDGTLILPSEDEERDMYHAGVERLRRYGYKQYEISNFAKKGEESKHNILYWEIDDYIGLGLSSSGFLNNERYINHYHISDYKNSIEKNEKPVSGIELINKEEQLYEGIILGLRLNKGISAKLLKEKTTLDMDEIYKEEIIKNIDKKLLVKEGEIYKLTKLGIDISNQVFVDFIPK
ncbi:MAG: radical SAM family heme chaperone HemW [Acidaminobacteraceae bacterium]